MCGRWTVCITSLINEPCTMQNMKRNIYDTDTTVIFYSFFLYFDWKSWTLKTHFIRPKYPHIINFLLCTCVHKFEFISNRFLGSHLSFFVRRYIRSSYWNLFISEKSEFITFWVKKKKDESRVVVCPFPLRTISIKKFMAKRNCV